MQQEKNPKLITLFNGFATQQEQQLLLQLASTIHLKNNSRF